MEQIQGLILQHLELVSRTQGRIIKIKDSWELNGLFYRFDDKDSPQGRGTPGNVCPGTISNQNTPFSIQPWTQLLESRLTIICN